MKSSITLRAVFLLATGLCLAIGADAQKVKKPTPPVATPGSGVGGSTGAGTGSSTGSGTGTANGSGTGTTGTGITAPRGGAIGIPSGAGAGSVKGGLGTPSGASSTGATGQGTGAVSGDGTGIGTGTGVIQGPSVNGRPLVTDMKGRCYYFTARGNKRYVAPSRCVWIID